MKKRLVAALMAVVMLFCCGITSYAALPVGTILDILSFCDIVYNVWSIVYPKLVEDNEIAKAQYLGYWNEIIDGSGISEIDFRAYWLEVVACDGSPAYFVGTDYTAEEQTAMINAYTYLIETVATGLSLDDVCAYCFTNIDNGYVDDSGNVVVGGDTFNDIIARLNEQYSPKANSDTKIISWKDDPYWSANTNNPDAAQLTVFFGSNLWCGQNWTSCYMVPFYYDGTTYYYGEYQYYWYFSEPVNVDGSNVIMTNCDVTSYITGETVTHTDLFDRAVASYFDMSVPGYMTNNVDAYVKGFATLNAIGAAKAVKLYPIDITYSRTFYNTVRDSVIMPLSTGTAVGFNAAPSSDVSENIGFICSSQPISLIFEWEQFPSDTYITIGGDNIYNYTISNPDTGENTTIYNYITNNYNFPASDNDDDDDNSGSGTTGGDVNVSGDITVSGGVDVGGQVDVNINVNVNDNGGSGDSGTTESQPSYIDGINTDLDAYLEKTPQMAEGFISYLQMMLNFLPAELYGLIILSIVIAIWCRLAGR